MSGPEDNWPEHMAMVNKDGRDAEMRHGFPHKVIALMAYGAMLARNQDGEFNAVLAEMRKVLWPPPPMEMSEMFSLPPSNGEEA